MKQERIKYKDIIELGFKEVKAHDRVYFEHHGFEFIITTKDLTPTIYVDWERSTGKCIVQRIDNKKHGNVLGTMKVYNLKHLQELIKFFK